MEIESKKGTAILALDGGGVRGVTAFRILHEIAGRIQRREGLASPPNLLSYF